MIAKGIFNVTFTLNFSEYCVYEVKEVAETSAQRACIRIDKHGAIIGRVRKKSMRIRCQSSNFIFTSYSNTVFCFKNYAMWLKGILTLNIIHKPKIALYLFVK